MGGVKSKKFDKLPEFPKDIFIKRLNEINKMKVDTEGLRELILSEIAYGYKSKAEREVTNRNEFASNLKEYWQVKSIFNKTGLDVLIPISFEDFSKNVKYHINEMDNALNDLITAIKKVQKVNQEELTLTMETISVINKIDQLYSKAKEENWDIHLIEYLESLYISLNKFLQGEKVEVPVPSNVPEPYIGKMISLYDTIKTIFWKAEGKNLSEVFKMFNEINQKANDYIHTLAEHDAFGPESYIMVNQLVMFSYNGIIKEDIITLLKSSHRMLYKTMLDRMTDETKDYMVKKSEDIVNLNTAIVEQQKRKQLTNLSEIIKIRMWEYIEAVMRGAKERTEKSSLYWLKVKIKCWMFEKGFIDENSLTESEDLYLRTGFKPWKLSKQEAKEILENKEDIEKRYLIPAVDVLEEIDKALSVPFEDMLAEVYKELKAGMDNVEDKLKKFVKYVRRKEEEIKELIE